MHPVVGRVVSLCFLSGAMLGICGCPDPPAADPPANATAPALQPPKPSPQSSPRQNSSGLNAAPAAPQTNPNQAAAVRQLITDVEGAYNTGLNNYRSGQIDAARASFDHAVDLMLSSPLDVRGTPELSNEFDKIIEGINTMEIATLQKGEGITQQVDISPAEEANDVTFPVDPNLRARAEAEVKTVQSDLRMCPSTQRD